MPRKIGLGAHKERFLAAVRDYGTVRAGCEAGRIHRNQFASWLKEDDFSNAYKGALEDFADFLEKALVEEIKTPASKFNTIALIFALKGVRPEKYREHSIMTDAAERLRTVETIREAFQGTPVPGGKKKSREARRNEERERVAETIHEMDRNGHQEVD